MAFFVTVLYVLLTFVSVGEALPGLAEYRVELILAIVGIILTLPRLFVRGQFLYQKQVTLMAAFSGMVLASWVVHASIGGVIATTQEFLPLGIVFFLTAFNVRSIGQLRILRFCLLALTVYLAVHGLREYFYNPDDSPFVLPQHLEGFDTIYRLRAQGLLADPNAFAQYMLALLPLLCVGMKSRRWGYRIAVILPIGALLLTAIFFTHSRGALIGAVVLIGLLVQQRMRFASGGLASAIAAVILIAAGFTGGRSISIGGGMDRLDIWSEGLGLFKSSPIWGIGFDGFMERERFTAHNSFLLCAAELGLIGLFLWVGLLIVSAWQLRRIAKANLTEEGDPELRSWANAVFFSLIAFLTPGFFLSETYAPMLYLILGMSAAVTRLAMVESGGVELLPEKSHWMRKTAGTSLAAIALIYILVRLRAV
jgi:putative inorganic carbon (hco3(-)) transporter